MRFDPAPDFEKIVADSIQAGLVEVASDITDRAGQYVDTFSGDYERSLRVTVDDRGVVAESTDMAAHIIEWGAIKRPPQWPLTRASNDVGRFDPA